jgi:hypothetical protein
MTVSGGAISCDSNGCFTSLALLSGAEKFAPPSTRKIRGRARAEGWTVDHQDRDLCSKHTQQGLHLVV